ncbi:uncharacterized protein ATC70_004850 [Mucor velutinosus]|uniref:Uncharacterized protein n=1 Tax=Mucor velutinosus TaxID=708070 RepID=A0AAN7D9L0_9FUNG|nr:hypothetical protein ATC70_004850 [Mucor velutinosus]
MAKERKPIATRTRNRTKSQDDSSSAPLRSAPISSAESSPNVENPPNVKHKKVDKKSKKKKSRKHKGKGKSKDKNYKKDPEFRELQYELPYLPKSNLDIYLQELQQLPSSFLRGTTSEKRRDILRNDQDAYYDKTRFRPVDDSEDGLRFLTKDDMSHHNKSRDYSVCLHRAFIKKRYLSDQECMHLAQYVDCGFYTQSLQELATLIKDELYMYRIDFTQRHLHHIRTMNITEEAFLSNEKGLQEVLEQQLNEDYLKYFWGSWIVQPFVDPVSFFSIRGNKNLLAKLTAKTLIEHLKYFFNIITTKKLNEELKKMDKISIDIILPPPPPPPPSP